MNKFYVTFNDIEKYVKMLNHAIQAKGWQIDRIIGVTRGGAIPAIMLSHSLGVPVQFIEAISYDDNQQRSNSVFINTAMLHSIDHYNTHHCLIVDDIYDSGSTMNKLHALFPNAQKAVLITKETDHIIAYDMLSTETAPADCWVVFPWEKR